MKNILILATLLLASCGDNKSNNKGENNNNNNNNNPVVWSVGQPEDFNGKWTEGEVTDQHYQLRPEVDYHVHYGWVHLETNHEDQLPVMLRPALNLPSPDYWFGWTEDFDPRVHFTAGGKWVGSITLN